MLPNERGRLFKTLRRLHGHNVDSGLNDLTEAFASFMTRARYFSIGHLRRTWSHSAVEFMKYRRRLPQILAGDDDEVGNSSKIDLTRDESASNLTECVADATKCRRVFVANVPSKVTTTQLASFFSKFGKVVSCSVPVERGSASIPRRSKGRAYVTFQNAEDATKALHAPPSELSLYNRTMVVTLVARAPQKRHSEHYGSSGAFKLGAGDDSDVPLASAEDAESLVSESETEQTSTPSSPSLSTSSINVLPNRVLVKVFACLNLLDRVRIERVCKRWQEMSFESWKSTKDLSFRSTFSLFRNRPLQNPTFKSILYRCGPHLQTLDLTGATHFLNDQSLTIVAETCRKLNHINLTGVKVDWKALKAFAELCGPQLETIIYRDAYFLSEKGFWWLFRFCANLKTVDLGMCARMTGRCFRLLGNRLENVCLDGCRRLHPAAVEEMSLKSPELRRLIVDDCYKLNNASLALISRSFANLEAFSMKGGPFPGVTASGLCQLGRLARLGELHLDRNASVDDSVLRAIADGCATSLKFLTLSQAGANETLTRAGLMELVACTRLMELDFSYLAGVTDSVLERLTAVNGGLETIRLRGCTYVSDKGVESLVRNDCVLLQELDVSGCLAVTNRSIEKFFDVPRRLALTITVGGTSCEAQKLFRRLECLPADRATKTVLDTMDLCRSQLRPGFDEFQQRTSIEREDLYIDDDDINDDDEFESLTAHRSFVLDELDEDDLLPTEEDPLDDHL